MKKVLKSAAVFIAILLCLSGCNVKGLLEIKKEIGEVSYDKLTINLKLTNPEDDDGKYSIYFVVPGKLRADISHKTTEGLFGPFMTDENGSVTVDLADNFAYVNQYLSDKESTYSGYLQLVVTTEEDVGLLNPLNDELFIKFDVMSSDGKSIWGAEMRNLTLFITDKYPMGICSLLYPEASFAVKLDFSLSTHSNFNKIFQADFRFSDGTVLSRSCGLATYWEIPMYVAETAGKTATVVLWDTTDMADYVEYYNYPVTVTFDAEGKADCGDILYIKMP